MPKIIDKPTIIEAAGNLSKVIEEYIGRVNSENSEVSIARMKSPSGWEEPGQTPEFTEFTVVLKGILKVETESGEYQIKAGQAFIAYPGDWVRYSSPETDGAEYIAVCVPAFSIDKVNRAN